MLSYSGPFARVRAGNKKVNTSSASNRLNSSALSSATGKTRAERRKPEWHADISDLDRYKLTKEEMLRKKSLFVSKHNIFASPSASKSSSKKTMRKKRESTAKPETDRIKDPLLELTSLDYLKEEVDEDHSGNSVSSSAEDISEASSDDDAQVVTPTSKRTIERRPASVRPSPNADRDVDVTVDLFKPTHSAARPASVPTMKRSEPDVDSSARSLSSASPRHRVGFAVQKSKTSSAKRTPSSNVSGGGNTTSALQAAVPKDVLEILVGLQHELRSYEQISGKRSVFDESELDDLLATYTAEDGEGNQEGVSLEGVMRYLLQLVCQSMTYLLESEIKINQQKTDYDTLSKRVDLLTTLIASGAANVASGGSKTAPSPIEGDGVQAKNAVKPDLDALLSRYDVHSVDDIFSRGVAPSGDAPTKPFSIPSTPSASPMNTTSLPKYDGDISSAPRKMGTSTSDWLFASPIANVGSPGTPVTATSLYSRNTASPGIAMKQPTDAHSHSKRGVDEAFLSQRAKQAARVSGRQVTDFLENSLDETSMYYSTANDLSERHEDESDKKYHENLNSVARRLHMEEGSIDDSAQYDPSMLSAALELPPPPPPMMMSTPDRSGAPASHIEYQNAPALSSSRVEKLQRALQTNARTAAVSTMDYSMSLNSSDLVSAPSAAAPFRPGGEQLSVGGPMAHVPLPLAAPQHPFKQHSQQRGDAASASSASKMQKDTTPAVNLLDSFRGRLTFDATRGSY